MNTGIEYVDMVKFVQSLAEKDERIQIVNAGVNIRQMLDQYGFPFKSKEFAKTVYTHQNHPWSKTVQKYLNGSSRRFQCPAKLRYIFENQMPFKISHLCCQKLKKDAFKRWTKESGKTVPIIGLRMAEGGNEATDHSVSIIRRKVIFRISSQSIHAQTNGAIGTSKGVKSNCVNCTIHHSISSEQVVKVAHSRSKFNMNWT